MMDESSQPFLTKEDYHHEENMSLSNRDSEEITYTFLKPSGYLRQFVYQPLTVHVVLVALYTILFIFLNRSTPECLNVLCRFTCVR